MRKVFAAFLTLALCCSFGGEILTNEAIARPSSRSSFRPTRPTKNKSTPTRPKSTNKSQNTRVDSAAARARTQQQSKSKFVSSNKPKSSYKTKNGKTVKVDSKAKSTQSVRKLSSEQYTNRTTRVENHYHTHYGSRYDYYRSQPYVYVGGGYDALFWYAMMDWQMDRQARWFYHNQNTIDTTLYQQTVNENAQLKAEITRLQSENVAVDPNYVDAEFADQPDLMYSQEFVDAAYNPEVVEESSGGAWLVWGIMFILVAGVIVVFVFVIDW